MAKKKDCKKSTSYNCGNSCINDQYVCRVKSLKTKTKKVADGMSSVIDEVERMMALQDAALASAAKSSGSAGSSSAGDDELAKMLALQDEALSSAKPSTADNADAELERMLALQDAALASASSSPGTFSTPVANSPERAERRQYIQDTYFGGDQEAVRVFEESISNLVKDLPVKIRIDQSTVDIINSGDGRLKNTHETNTSGGLDDKEYRLEIEEKQFGYGKDIADIDRPKYGYVYGPKDNVLKPYGDSVYEATNLKPEQYTVTFGDSLDSGAYSSKANDVKIESVSEEIYQFTPDLNNINSLTDLGITDYIEAQIGGPVNFNETFTRL